MPAEPVRRREPDTPARPVTVFAVAAVGTRVPLPQLEANRAAADQPSTEPLESAVPPPRKATDQKPRDTRAAVESVATSSTAPGTGATSLETPSKLFQIEPPYPPESLARRESGVVKIRVRIDSQGRVVHAEIHESSGFTLLDRSALETIYRWRYIVVGADGNAKAKEFIEPVRFKLPPRTSRN